MPRSRVDQHGPLALPIVVLAVHEFLATQLHCRIDTRGDVRHLNVRHPLDGSASYSGGLGPSPIIGVPSLLERSSRHNGEDPVVSTLE